ncbi:NAD-dependent epimerase/dehydratase family protein [Rubritalea tangerina]|uniref:NAD-dependent epimerase/dehydratase family protein n=1 Tax=Rubritalea tangerina TaxID=430798 RepID=A0ABW4ZFK1_9BACT
MNVLITGGAGFIGSNLCAFHLKRGDRVVAVDDLSTGRSQNIEALRGESNFRFIQADLLDWNELNNEVAKAERIYHLAAVVGMFRVLKEPVEVTSVNVCATERVLEAAVKGGHDPKVVIASSSSVYGHSNEQLKLHEDVDLVFSPERGGLTGYALSKLSNEIQARAYHEEYGLRVVIPRLFNSVGPNQSGNYGFVIPRFINQAIAGEPLTVFGDGTQIRSFCDVRDTIAALDTLAAIGDDYEEIRNAEVVNVGNDREISILDTAKMVIARSGSTSSIKFISYDEAYGEHFDHITQRRPVIEKLERLTGFVPRWSLEQTIDDLLQKKLNNTTY